MPFKQFKFMKVFQFESLMLPGITHAAFTRHGGVSESPYASLNVGATVGDDLEKVKINRQRCFNLMSRNIHTRFDSWLVHGTDVLYANAPHPPSMPSPPKADIIITDKPEVTLFMRYADCVPLLFYDPIKRVVALAHAGWQGTVDRVGQAAVEAMESRYGSKPGNILAVIGPSISPENYEVGEDVISVVREKFGDTAFSLLPEYGESTHFDLWAANQLVLEEAGITTIEQSGMCTFEHVEDWFSHRAEKGSTGRFGVLLALEP